MIIVDIETSGLFPENNGIWQIGAVDFGNPENTFLEEGRIDAEDKVTDEAMEIIGKDESYLRANEKQSQKELLEKFFNWTKNVQIKNCVCQNPQFDLGFILMKARKYGLDLPFHYRSFDLHSIAASKHFEIKGDFLLNEDHSDMSLPNILEFCGMKDERQAHNALEDAKLTAECLSRIWGGKSMFQEYEKFEVPEGLKK
jgi:DNA polymerase III epsilon subunit-like protein